MGVVVDTGVFNRWERDGRGIDLTQWAALGEPYDLLTTNASEFNLVPNLRVMEYKNTS